MQMVRAEVLHFFRSICTKFPVPFCCLLASSRKLFDPPIRFKVWNDWKKKSCYLTWEEISNQKVCLHGKRPWCCPLILMTFLLSLSWSSRNDWGGGLRDDRSTGHKVLNWLDKFWLNFPRVDLIYSRRLKFPICP